MSRLYSLVLAASLGAATNSLAQYAPKDQYAAHYAGVVLNEEVPLPGATVFVQGKFIAPSTNSLGQFRLPVAGLSFPLTLVVSYVGCASQELVLNLRQLRGLNQQNHPGLDHRPRNISESRR